jgi:hypothetical protein
VRRHDIVFWLHRLYFNYDMRHYYIIFRPHRLYVDYSSLLILTRNLVESGYHASNNYSE